jgi:Mlc titration factor MtfA (ptsG expression regulator)
MGRSDIDPYGATNLSEFLAVSGEYFFERPDLLKHKHPELYQLLNQMFSGKISS